MKIKVTQRYEHGELGYERTIEAELEDIGYVGPEDVETQVVENRARLLASLLSEIPFASK